MSTKTEDLVTMIETLSASLAALNDRVTALETKSTASNRSSPSSRTMTDDDALRVLGGDLADDKHKDAAEKLGLSYGQIYSARMGFTFKGVAAQLKATGLKNRWVG